MKLLVAVCSIFKPFQKSTPYYVQQTESRDKKNLEDQQTSEDQKPSFEVGAVLRKEGEMKIVFKYYTEIAYIRFSSLFGFFGT